MIVIERKPPPKPGLASARAFLDRADSATTSRMVASARQGAWLPPQARGMRGLGMAMSEVPTWAWVAGGLALGAGGYMLYKRKK